MKTFEKLLREEMTRGEANKLFLLVAIVGFAIVTMVKGMVCTSQILLTQDCVMYWIGVDTAVAGIIGLIVNNLSDEQDEG